MVELTELPLDWCIKITKENKDVLTKWKQTVKPESDEAGHYESNYVNNEGLNRINSHEYIVISFEQFKKWVLKENVQYTHEVVHCTTQKEWDFVLQNNKNSICSKSNIQWYKTKDICFVFGKNKYGTQSNITYFKHCNSLILSFQEWCDKFGHVNPFINGLLSTEEFDPLTEVNITNGLTNIRINHNFNKPIKTNNVLLLDTVIQPIVKEEKLSSIIKLVKPKQTLKIK